jgi:histone-lysine N-methyltransferase SETD3
MNILPNVNEVNPTFTWSDDDLAFLQGSPVISATKSLKAKLKREYDDLLFGIRDESIVGKGFGHAGLCNMYPNLFPKEHYTYQNWKWAFTMLFSRAIRLRNMKAGETLALVPYADLINHSPYSSSYLDARETGDWLFKTGGEEVILYADRGYKRMEQIYISYGQKSNADLLLLYGFALERNPFNSVDVTVSIANTLLETDPLADEKRTFLQKVGRGYTVDFPCYADRYPTEMLEYLRLIMMTPEDTRGKSLTDFNYSRTVSAANEASVLYSIISAIQTQLSRYPNTEEQDAEIIKDKALFRLLSYNQRMAVRHRRNEKRLLKRTIAALEKQIVSRGLDASDLARAEGSTIGTILPGERKGAGKKERSDLEDRLDRMGLPVDLR